MAKLGTTEEHFFKKRLLIQKYSFVIDFHGRCSFSLNSMKLFPVIRFTLKIHQEATFQEGIRSTLKQIFMCLKKTDSEATGGTESK